MPVAAPFRSRHLAALLLLLAAARSAEAQAPAAPQPARAQVMVLGTMHWDNPGLDYGNPQVDDVLSPRRQPEVQALLDALAEFRPTRIALEAEPSRDSTWNDRYRRYRAGSVTLGRDERDQIGLRLAARLGHDRVYAVDYQNGMDVSGVLGWAAQNGQERIAQRIGGHIQAAVAGIDSTTRISTLGETLRLYNGARMDSLDIMYLLMAPIGRDTAYLGADMVAGWYERNLKIFVNITRLAAPGERVLVIMGAGHGPLLRRFIDESPDYDLVRVDPYLARFRNTQGL